MDMRTPLRRVSHFGAAKEGTGDFIRQRVTALANVPLLLFGVWLAITCMGASRAEIVGLFGNPVVAGLAILLIVSVCIHMRIGVQEVVVDYVHNELLKVLVLVANSFFSYGILALSVVSILKMSFGG